jgi:transcription-repair coupling factor (superfamily II helicase)
MAGGAEYRAFQAGFPFEETADQAAAIEQVLADMKSGKPMDRVICGDVGFGKTEVAMRAAFVAVQAGRRSRCWCPRPCSRSSTTQTFRDRFADWPVRIESLSRFRSGKEADGARGPRSGHRSTSSSPRSACCTAMRFKDLGLIVIDEEHRFGVRDKERLKALRAEVHVLTLTATPIPRTLNMALGGLRDLSLITTPPAGTPGHQDLRHSNGTRPTCARRPARTAPRRPDLLRAQRDRDHREDRQAIRELVPEASVRSATARCASASSSS